MRVGIVSLIHESNTFLATPTTIDLFRRDCLFVGEAVREYFRDNKQEQAGFFQGLERHDIQAVPIFYASTSPSGVLLQETCEELLRIMFDAIEQAGPVDGYLLAPHGANTGEGDLYRDLDGYWLSKLRKTVGTDVPLIFVMDLHGNVSPAMVRATDAGIFYRTNPHADQLERGIEAAELMARTLRGVARPTHAAAYPPMVINIERQNTSEQHFAALNALADEMRKRPGVLSVSIAHGFPYADVEEMGTVTLAVTDNDPALAQRCADELADYLVDHRGDFAGRFIDVKSAVEQALASPGPVGLLDMGDNVGGGSAADGTILAHELHQRSAAPAFLCIYDPQSAHQAAAAGMGATLDMRIGGKTDRMHGPPLQTSAKVVRISEGKFHESGIVHGGRSEYDMGPVVTVQTPSKLTINLTERRVVPSSIGHITSCGLDPRAFQVIVAKGVHSPLLGLAPYCRKLIRVNTPGATCADLSNFQYRYRRKPLFPFEEISPTRVRGAHGNAVGSS